jgi:hypothetical protein
MSVKALLQMFWVEATPLPISENFDRLTLTPCTILLWTLDLAEGECLQGAQENRIKRITIQAPQELLFVEEAVGAAESLPHRTK